MERRGHDPYKLKAIIATLAHDSFILASYKDHALRGNYA